MREAPAPYPRDLRLPKNILKIGIILRFLSRKTPRPPGPPARAQTTQFSAWRKMCRVHHAREVTRLVEPGQPATGPLMMSAGGLFN